MRRTIYKFIILIFLVSIGSIINICYAENNNKTDIQKISGIVGVFFGPNEAEVERINRENGEGVSEYVDDSQYYQRLAYDFLNQKGIKTIFTTSRYLFFTKDNGEVFEIDRDKLNLKDWGVYIFDGKQDPLLVGFLGDVKFNEYINYFNLKNVDLIESKNYKMTYLFIVILFLIGFIYLKISKKL